MTDTSNTTPLKILLLRDGCGVVVRTAGFHAKRLAVGVQTVDRSSQEVTYNQICLSDDFESGNYNDIVWLTS